MSTLQVLVAGATGSVGREAVALFKKQGHRVTALSRSANLLSGVADRVMPFDATAGIPELAGHDVVVSALGGPVSLRHRDSRSYRQVDYKANLNLLEACKRAGIGRMVYVAAHVEPGYADTAYIRAHEEFAAALRATRTITSTVVRPTGLFTAFDELYTMAMRGALPVWNGGGARTNPIHPADVAKALSNVLEQGPADLNIGGPLTLARRDILYLIFGALNKRPHLVQLPAGVVHFAGKLLTFANPRLGELLQFVSKVSIVDAVAPTFGTHRIENYFEDLARRTLPEASVLETEKR